MSRQSDTDLQPNIQDLLGLGMVVGLALTGDMVLVSLSSLDNGQHVRDQVGGKNERRIPRRKPRQR